MGRQPSARERFSGNWDCEGVIVDGGLPQAPRDVPDRIHDIHLDP